MPHNDALSLKDRDAHVVIVTTAFIITFQHSSTNMAPFANQAIILETTFTKSY